MHMVRQHATTDVYNSAVTEDAGDAFTVDERVAPEQVPCTNQPFMEELERLDLFDSIRAATLDSACDAVGVRGVDNLPWECGEHPALGQQQNVMSQTLNDLRLRQRGLDNPFLATDVKNAKLINCRWRQRRKSTPDIVNDIFNYVTDKAYAEVFEGQPYAGAVYLKTSASACWAVWVLARGCLYCRAQYATGTEMLLCLLHRKKWRLWTPSRCNPLQEVFRRDPEWCVASRCVPSAATNFS